MLLCQTKRQRGFQELALYRSDKRFNIIYIVSQIILIVLLVRTAVVCGYLHKPVLIAVDGYKKRLHFVMQALFRAH